MRLIIACKKCGGPMWEEEEPGTNRVLSLSCINCGRRSFINKIKYLKFKKNLYEKTRANQRGALPKPARDI